MLWGRDWRAAAVPAAKRRLQRVRGTEQWHARERRNFQREANARVLALKAHNYEEYLRLARNAKDERLRDLLKTTDKIMVDLGVKVGGSCLLVVHGRLHVAPM